MNHLVSVPDKGHDILGGKLVGGQQVHQDARQLGDLLHFCAIYASNRLARLPT